VKLSGQRLQVPVNALLFRSEGLRAVTVDENHKTHLKPLTIGRDYGTSLEVVQGLSATDLIVINPADSLEEGVQVNVKEIPAAAVPGGAGASAAPGAAGKGGNASGANGNAGKENANSQGGGERKKP